MLAVVIPLLVYLALHNSYGFYTGTNYDAYQYSYALREGPNLEATNFATTSRVFVHAMYYFILRPLVVLGVDAWSLFALSSMLFTVISCLLIHYLAQELSAGPYLALTASVLWGLSATALYYANIPEIYPMWWVAQFLTVMALWRKRPMLALLGYILSFNVFVQSILIVPMFLRLGFWRGLKWGTAAVALGFAVLLVLLNTTGVPFMSHFARESIYLDIASSDSEWLKTNIVALRQSGILLPLLLSIPLAVTFADSTVLFLLLGIVPNLVFGLIWVKDQGAFLSPAAALIILMFTYLTGKVKGHRLLATVALVFSIPMFTYAWQEAAYDRSLGRVQIDFCLSASKLLEEGVPVVSTSLFPRWLYAFSVERLDYGLLKYSPWAYVESQAAAMQTAQHDLFPQGSLVYADDSVHPDIMHGLHTEVIYAHRGILSNGYPAEFKLHRVVGSDTD